MRFVPVSLFAFTTLALFACSSGDAATDEDELGAKKKVAGYDMTGPQIKERLAKNMACPQIADAVTDACIAAQGKTTYTKGCGILCSVPVAPKGKVAGFDLTGFRSADPLPANMACPQVADAVTDACIEASAKTTYIKGCGVICSVPVAPKGKVAGFDFSGLQSKDRLPAGMACAQVADAVTDACIAAGARTVYTAGCGILCSAPIAK